MSDAGNYIVNRGGGKYIDSVTLQHIQAANIGTEDETRQHMDASRMGRESLVSAPVKWKKQEKKRVNMEPSTVRAVL